MLETGEDEVAKGLGGLPGEHVRAEAVVGEAFGWVDKSVTGEFETDVDLLENGLVGVGGFIWVVLDCEPSESGL